MRISQIKTLCWTANVLVLAGAGYVGLHFYRTYQTYRSRLAPTDVEWPDKAARDVIQKRWPGEITGFEVIWKTPIAGEVPPPPVPKDTGPGPKRDPAAEFLKKHQYTGNILDVSDPASSLAYVRVVGAKEDVALRTGQSIDGFMLIGFDRNPDNGQPVLVFRSDDVEGLVRLEMPEEPVPQVVGPPVVTPLLAGNDLVKPEVTRTEIPRRAYQDLLADPSGLTWRMPPEEVEWWSRFGEDEVFSKLVVNVVEDASGNPAGLRVMSQPGQGTPAGDGRGLSRGDIVRAVNGVPVRGKEDVLRYLRGDGRGLERYDVLVESENGVERTIVYLIERPVHRVPLR